MTIGRLGIILLAIVMFAGCNDDQPKTGTYRYTAFLNNVPVVEGTMQIDSLSAQNASGRWDFHFVGEPRNDVGPQVGTGTFTGSFDGSAFIVNLNPQFADNNVTLHGRFSGNTLRGEWSWSGIAGVMNQGTFIAERQ